MGISVLMVSTRRSWWWQSVYSAVGLPFHSPASNGDRATAQCTMWRNCKKRIQQQKEGWQEHMRREAIVAVIIIIEESKMTRGQHRGKSPISEETCHKGCTTILCWKWKRDRTNSWGVGLRALWQGSETIPYGHWSLRRPLGNSRTERNAREVSVKARCITLHTWMLFEREQPQEYTVYILQNDYWGEYVWPHWLSRHSLRIPQQSVFRCSVLYRSLKALKAFLISRPNIVL